MPAFAPKLNMNWLKFPIAISAITREVIQKFSTPSVSRWLIDCAVPPKKVADLSFLDVTGRIASTLLELSKEPDAMTHPQGMQIKITRQELGRIVNCSREMAGRVLKDLEEQGLIEVHGKTIVVYGTR